MEVIQTLQELIRQGEELVPQGGSQFQGYNGQRQPDYVAWRLQAMAVIEELGKAARPLLRELEEDKEGPYFYQSSASRVLGVLKGALAIAERQARAQPTIPAEQPSKSPSAETLTRVFIVHGRD